MSGTRYPIRTERSLTVAIFLGGLTLTALTVIFGLEINYPPILFLSMTISYKELLILISGIGAALLITSVFGLKSVLVRGQSEDEFFAKFVFAFYEAGFFAILVLVLPLLVLPFSTVTAVVILIVEASWFTVWFIDVLKRWKRRKSASKRYP